MIYPQPKPASRLSVKSAARKDDRTQLSVWRNAIFKRDKGLCRCCGVKVIRCLELCDKRAECHHLEGRANKAVRYDVRNGVLLCAWCHESVERGKLRVEARESFVVGQRAYFNADLQLIFHGVTRGSGW